MKKEVLRKLLGPGLKWPEDKEEAKEIQEALAKEVRIVPIGGPPGYIAGVDQIAVYARKIATVHGTRYPEVIRIATIFEKIASDMAAHLKEEEEVLFPAIKRAKTALIAGATPDAQDRETIRTSLLRLHREHEEIGDAIHEIRHLSKEFPFSFVRP